MSVSFLKMFISVVTNLIILRSLNEPYPFSDYAADNLGHHIRFCDQDQSLNIISRFLEDSRTISTYLRAKSWLNTYPENHSSLHVACSLGHEKAVRQLLANGANVVASDSTGDIRKSAIYLKCLKMS
jgi:ankyrin repeat protein